MKRRKFVKIIGVTTAGMMMPVRYINAEGQPVFDLNPATMITDNEEALQNLKFQKAMQQLEDPLQIISLKKEEA